jgi:hypothetical protein
MPATTRVTGLEACYWKWFRPIIRQVDCAPVAPESSIEEGRLRKLIIMLSHKCVLPVPNPPFFIVADANVGLSRMFLRVDMERRPRGLPARNAAQRQEAHRRIHLLNFSPWHIFFV